MNYGPVQPRANPKCAFPVQPTANMQQAKYLSQTINGWLAKYTMLKKSNCFELFLCQTFLLATVFIKPIAVLTQI